MGNLLPQRLLGPPEAQGLETHLFWECLGNLEKLGLDADFPEALGDGVRHGLDVPVGAVVYNENHRALGFHRDACIGFLRWRGRFPLGVRTNNGGLLRWNLRVLNSIWLALQATHSEAEGRLRGISSARKECSVTVRLLGSQSVAQFGRLVAIDAGETVGDASDACVSVLRLATGV